MDRGRGIGREEIGRGREGGREGGSNQLLIVMQPSLAPHLIIRHAIMALPFGLVSRYKVVAMRIYCHEGGGVTWELHEEAKAHKQRTIEYCHTAPLTPHHAQSWQCSPA